MFFGPLLIESFKRTETALEDESMYGFPSLVPSSRRSSCRTALLSAIALSILSAGIGCGDFTLFGEDEQGICNPDPCASTANATAGTCADLGDDDYSCGCRSGYFWDADGNTCEDPCASDPCDSIENAVDGSCEGISLTDYDCDCDDGFVWDGATESCEDDPCDPDPCAGIEDATPDTCTAVGGDDYTCDCGAGYFWGAAGNTCENPCASDPCDTILNAEAGSCTGIGADDFTCDCDIGFAWIAQINQCGPSDVGTCDDLEACLLTCNGFEDFSCQNLCYATWTGCDCDLDLNDVLTSCVFFCLGDCTQSNPFTKSCWDCVIPCGFDSQCQ